MPDFFVQFMHRKRTFCPLPNLQSITTINRKLVGKMSQTDFTLEVLGIKDPNITVLNVTNEHINRESICRITSKLTYPVNHCANCGFKQVVKNGFRKAHVRLASLNGIRYELELWKQRFYCKHCCTTFGAKTDIVEFNHTLSRAIKKSSYDVHS